MEITSLDVMEFINQMPEPRKKDIIELSLMMKTITQKEPKLWGTIIGFGSLHYKYKTGTEGDMPILGLASRKQAITLYLSYDIEKYQELKSLGKYTHGKGCLYIKKLSDININVLDTLMRHAYDDVMKLSFVKENEV